MAPIRACADRALGKPHKIGIHWQDACYATLSIPATGTCYFLLHDIRHTYSDGTSSQFDTAQFRRYETAAAAAAAAAVYIVYSVYMTILGEQHSNSTATARSIALNDTSLIPLLALSCVLV
eukprot:942-Heterococcus_DN1.PRE.2